MMNKNKIVFLCHFSNQAIRDRLSLKRFTFRRWLSKIRGVQSYCYQDFAIWVSDYIEQFEKHTEFEFHIIAPHKGMRSKMQDFNLNGLFYHFFKYDGCYLYDMVQEHFHLEEKNDYRKNRSAIKEIVGRINPDVVLLCGAENPYYSLAVLDVKNKPVYVILQTLLNDIKRIEMGVGSEYRRTVELEVFKHAGYFCTLDNKAIKTIKRVNLKAVCLPSGFPTHRPCVPLDVEKESDFVFFSRIITKNKGIEDVLAALTIVKKEVPAVNLNIIGGCKPDYLSFLRNEVLRMGIQDNVRFLGYFQSIEDTYSRVAKAKIVVVPGITASLNSTVRESMLMGLPTICYEAPDILDINKDKTCLMMAKSCDVNDLAIKMQFALDNPDETSMIAKNGKQYAEREFGNESIVNKLLENCRQIIDKRV